MSPLIVQAMDEQAAAPAKMELTAVEANLSRLLLDVAKYIDSRPVPQHPEDSVRLPDDLAKEKIVLRFTGGWVRDKLLGVPSHDIDVAINKMTGFQFGLKLKEYLEIPGNPEKYGLEGISKSDKAGTTDKSKSVGGLHKIEANPEKSKHLETVTTKILGLDIDLVNLRKETYSEESRNPTMEFGTPEEDALRRDATVNAMFYNLNTDQVEDFTGRGKEDLQHQILRTPLEPYQTFKDDPLRVLRLIRFASRLGYRIDSQALQAMENMEIKDALRRKISRERVGIEVEKALKGPDPHEALRLIFELALYETIFSDPTIDLKAHYRPDTEGWQAIIDFLKDALDAEGPLAQILTRDAEEKYLAWQLAAMVPYRDAPQPEASEPGRRAPPPIASSVAREGIKATNKVCDIVTAAVKHQSEIAGLVDKLHQQKRRPDKKIEGEDASARDVLGMAIRRWGASWRSQVMYSMLVEVADEPNAMTTIERKYTTFIQHLQTLAILEAHTFKPLMDGKTLAKALSTPPGPWMKDALDVVMAYQLRNPDTNNTTDAIAEVQQSSQQTQNGGGGHGGGELPSSLIHHFLKLTIRPLFLKAKPSAVTDAGRKNTTTVLPKKMTLENMDDSVKKPWKGEKERYSLDLLRWCVAALNGKVVEDVWHLVVPPLLTLVDDWETKYKILGVEMVSKLLEITPAALLAKTGLGEVFEDALMPCLAYLPTITPEEESIPLLNAVYPALLTLSRLQYPHPLPSDSTKEASHPHSPQRIKFLDTIIRKGIIYGYTTCNTHPHILCVLFTHLIPLLDELGIDSVKHLKYILPMLTETLAHPLAADARTEILLLAAVRALQAVILNGWPRMHVHRGEVLKGLTFCWIKFDDKSGEGVEELKGEMKETVALLRAAVGTEVDFDADCRVLVQAEPRLRGLLLGDDAT